MSERHNQYRYGVLVSNHVEDRYGQDLAQKQPTTVKMGRTEAQGQFNQNHAIPIERSAMLESEKPENSTLSPQDLLNINNKNYNNGAMNIMMNQMNYKPSETGNFENKMATQENFGVRQTMSNMNTASKTATDLNQGGVGSNALVKSKDNRYSDPQILQEFNSLCQKNREFGEDGTVFFGHGLDVADFQKRDFKTVKELTMDKKISSSTVINSKYHPSQKREVKPLLEHQKNAPVVSGESSFKETREVSNPKPYSEFTKTYDASFAKIGLRGK